MRRFQCVLLAAVVVTGFVSTVHAADMPAPAAPAESSLPPAPYDWSGLYFGGHFGGGRESNELSDSPEIFGIFGSIIGFGLAGALNVPVQALNSSGILGGVQGGTNFQIGKLVVGTEADFSWAGISGSSTAFLTTPIISPFGLNRTLGANTSWIGTVTARMGIAHDRWLLYTKGGAAWAKNSYTDAYTASLTPPSTFSFAGAASETRSGWTVGTGLEWAFWNDWSAKIEYDYMNFGTRAVNNTGTAFNNFTNPRVLQVITTVQNNQNINEVKLGLNYKFMSNFW
jgi:outer membrane immunogenic protein